MCESQPPQLGDLEQLQMSEATLCLSRFTRPASPSQTRGSALLLKDSLYDIISSRSPDVGSCS